MSVGEPVRNAQKQLLYQKYANYYEEPSVVYSMVERAVEMGEIACIIFDEQSDDTHGITAEDLEDIFERGPVPLFMIIKKHIRGFRHILKTRSVNAIGLMEATVNVRYTIVWKRNAVPSRKVSTIHKNKKRRLIKEEEQRDDVHYISD